MRICSVTRTPISTGSLWLLLAAYWLGSELIQGQTVSRPARILTSYAITSDITHDYQDPGSWKLLASNNSGQSWIELDAQTNQIFQKRSQRKVFALTNRIAYGSYRLETVNTGALAMAELELMGPVTGVTNETDLCEIISASREHPLIGPAESAFDHDLTTRWLSYGNGNEISWLQCDYALQAAVCITNSSQLQVAAGRMAIRDPLGDATARILSNLNVQAQTPLRILIGYALTSAFDETSRDPRDWKLLGSNNGGKTWQTIDTRRNESFATRLQRRTFLLTQPASFSIYRLQIDCVRVPSNEKFGANSVQLAEIEPLFQQSDTKRHYSTVVSARGENPPAEIALAAFDGDASTKWLDFSEDGNTNHSSWLEWQYLEMPGLDIPLISRRWLQGNQRRQPPLKLRLDGVAVAWQPGNKRLSIVDPMGLQTLRIDGITNIIQPGERVQLSGQLVLGEKTPSVETPELKLQGLVAPLLRKQGEPALPANESFFLDSVEGQVRSFSEGPLYLTIRLAVGESEILVRIINQQSGGPVFFPGCRLKAHGVSQAVSQANGERRARILWVADIGMISMAATTQEDWNVWQQRRLEFLWRTNGIFNAMGSPARVVGTMIQQSLGHSLILARGTNQLLVYSTQKTPLALGSEVEVIGFLGREKDRPVLQMCQYRAEAKSKAPAQDKTTSLADTRSPARTIREIYERIDENPGTPFPVKVRGTITYIDLNLSDFYLQDGPDAIRGDEQLATGLAPHLHQEGSLIELEGTVYPPYALIHVTSFGTLLGPGQMPKPQQHLWDELILGREDDKWIQVEGIVTEADGHRLTLMQAGGRIIVWVNELEEALKKRLLGSVVRVSGVCSTVKNRNQRLGVRLLVPSEDHIQIVRAVPDDPFDLPMRPLNRVMQGDSGGSGQSVQLVRTAGVVTYHNSRLMFLQEGNEGLRVSLRTEASIDPGDRVEVVGFAEPDGFSPKLVQAIVRKVGQVSLPAVTPINLLDTDLNTQDATRASIEAVYMGGTIKESLQILDLQERKTARRFSAFVPVKGEHPPPIPVGSFLRFEGVFKADTDILPDFGQVLSSFQMYGSSQSDIVVLERPSWWTARHTLFGLAALGSVLLISLGWVGLLRNQVRRRTGELQVEISERKHTEQALQTSELFMRSLVGSLPLSILRKDVDGRFTFANDLFCKTFGKRMNQVTGKTDFDFFPAPLAAKFQADDHRVMETGKLFETVEEIPSPTSESTYVQMIKTPLHDAESKLIGLQVIYWDVTKKKLAEDRLEAAQKGLMDASRQAGMAEVATAVLHNVGNVLNSVNVSASLLSEKLRKSKITSMAKLAAMFHEHEASLGTFLTENPVGKQVPAYISQLSACLAAEQSSMVEEVNELTRNIEHINNIVAMQQSYATFRGVTELVRATDLVEDALRLNAGSLARHDVKLVREYAEHDLEITVEKHKVLQILINLIRNSKYACDESGRPDKRLTIRVTAKDGHAKISVADNGVGIPSENLTRVFNHGFTTRKDGHGFGLHSGALAAKEMGGTLEVQSDGPGKGATFILTLPLSQNSNPLEKVASTPK